ncbi:class I SAM-dependent methyltransferase [bacterium]|nr:class I SAM-dependent methyltransferase [bacterium]
MADNQKQQDVIWDYYQNKREETFSENKGRLDYILDNIQKGKVVLNIGIGDGYFEKVAKEKVKIYCLDPSEESINSLISSLSFTNLEAKMGFSTKIPFDNAFFDVVVMSEVLEHLSEDDLRQTLLEVQRVLKTGGQFIGTVPSNENLAENVVICPSCTHEYHRWGHQLSFSALDLKGILSTKFEVIKLIDRPFINFKGRNLFGKIKGFFRIFLYVTKLFPLYGNLFFIVKK